MDRENHTLKVLQKEEQANDDSSDAKDLEETTSEMKAKNADGENFSLFSKPPPSPVFKLAPRKDQIERPYTPLFSFKQTETNRGALPKEHAKPQVTWRLKSDTNQ